MATRYYTDKKQVPLKPDETVKYTPGKGYYAKKKPPKLRIAVIGASLLTAIAIAGATLSGSGGGDGNCNSPWTPAFASPGACGYPDPAPAYQNVGVPPGTTLTPSSIAATSDVCSANGPCTITAKSFSGSGNTILDVDTNNVTIQNSRFTETGDIGNGQVVKVEAGVTVTFSHVEFTATTSGAAGSPLLCGTNLCTIIVDHIYAHGNYVGFITGGNIVMTNSYSVVNTYDDIGHVENVYGDDATFDIEHNTIINQNHETATLFFQSPTAQSVPCTNHVTVKNNLLAGGTNVLGFCAHATSVGSSTADVENNRVARCHGTPTQASDGWWFCAGGGPISPGEDSFGQFPYGGSNPPGAMYFSDPGFSCPPTAGQTYVNNNWDDTGTPIPCQ